MNKINLELKNEVYKEVLKMDNEKIEQLQNEIENKLKQAFELLCSADDDMNDLFNIMGYNNIDNDLKQKCNKLFDCINIIKNEILDI